MTTDKRKEDQSLRPLSRTRRRRPDPGGQEPQGEGSALAGSAEVDRCRDHQDSDRWEGEDAGQQVVGRRHESGDRFLANAQIAPCPVPGGSIALTLSAADAMPSPGSWVSFGSKAFHAETRRRGGRSEQGHIDKFSASSFSPSPRLRVKRLSYSN